MDKDLLRGLSEKEVEIEHLKTTVIALSQKIEVKQIVEYPRLQIMKDMERDVNNHKMIT